MADITRADNLIADADKKMTALLQAMAEAFAEQGFEVPDVTLLDGSTLGSLAQPVEGPPFAAHTNAIQQVRPVSDLDPQLGNQFGNAGSVAQPPAAPVVAPIAPEPGLSDADLFTALGAIQAPAAPVQAPLPPAAPAPRGGGNINPQLLEQIRALLAPQGTPQINSLGSLISGQR